MIIKSTITIVSQYLIDMICIINDLSHNNNNMSLSILVDNGKALISFSCTFLSNSSDLTQR
ncbi:hypothetical protein BpHYR1_043777 [Brachionus plicatilis]|uniref:Uncharacterized protein n=1 Tax=Brachionus plicatilis TaxID=10195 RepID=A0A3M7RJX3_BRAPC|nr:hypothetical protein BpHYR1_043777 [Brachionus plicatilis]